MERAGEEEKPLFSSTETRHFTDTSVGQAGSGIESVKSLDEPPVDWFEPLEEDWEEDDDDDYDVQSWDIDGVRDAEMDSLAGESERSGSVAGSERNYRGGAVGYVHVGLRRILCLM